MDLINYCRSRQAILMFANRYPNANQTAFCTALNYQENPTILSPCGMLEQETHRTTNTTKKSLFFFKQFSIEHFSFYSPYSIAFLRYYLAFALYLHYT